MKHTNYEFLVIWNSKNLKEQNLATPTNSNLFFTKAMGIIIIFLFLEQFLANNTNHCNIN
jgi:hypothetical protein